MANKSKVPIQIIETIAGIAILLLVNHLWVSDNFGYIGVSPNPYWIVVIFIALRYGDLSGMLAGILCSAALLLSTSYNVTTHTENVWYNIPYQQWKLAGLFVVFGFLAGQERSAVAIRRRARPTASLGTGQRKPSTSASVSGSPACRRRSPAAATPGWPVT